MKLSQLRDIVAIVEHGSLRAAARSLQIAQPLLTRSVRTLERELGTPLFERDAKGMTLTPAGTLFHRRASIIVNEVRRAEEELRQIDHGGEGTVVAGLSIMPHTGLLPKALMPFQRRYPKVRLQLIEGLFPALEHRLREGSVDFYLGASPHQPPAQGLLLQKLFSNHRTVFCRQGHPLAGAGSLRELLDAEWGTTSVDYDARLELVQLFAQHALPAPSISLLAGSALSMMVALAETDLLAMLPVQWGDFAPFAGALQRIAVREVLPAPDIVLIRRPDLPLTPAAEHLVDLMMRWAPRDP